MEATENLLKRENPTDHCPLRVSAKSIVCNILPYSRDHGNQPSDKPASGWLSWDTESLNRVSLLAVAARTPASDSPTSGLALNISSPLPPSCLPTPFPPSFTLPTLV